MNEIMLMVDEYAQEVAVDTKTKVKIDLEAKATELWPESPALREKWLAAAAYLLRRKKWVLYGGAVKWRS